MKKVISLLFFLPCLCAEIIEVSHIDELLKYATQETLVIFDIDDTLLLPVQTLGNDVSFECRINQYQEKGLSKSEALEKSLAEWEAIRHLTQMKVVEEQAPIVVKELQSKGIVVMGMTTQGLALATRTVLQLNSLGIDLSLTCPSQNDYYFINGHGVLFRKGILFTAGTHKGHALLRFFKEIDFYPKKILFINDKCSHLIEVENVIGISFLGLRYAYGDERVASFSQEIFNTQWKYSTFEHILSDEEAIQILNH
jgi:Protein of unknown function (DUF2608)